MGNTHPGAPKELVLRLARALDIRCFVETGTHRAETASWAADHFERVITIELSPFMHAISARALEGRRNVELLQGDSRTHLARLAPTLPPSIVWLDAHWSERSTAGEQDQCPAPGELAALHTCWERAFIIVDDAHLFLAPPPFSYEESQWPDLRETIAQLGQGEGRFVASFEDVLVSMPAEARPVVSEYLHDAERMRAAESKFAGRAAWRSRFKRPVVLFCRALGHLPFLFTAQERLLWFLRDRFDWPRPPFEIAFRGQRYRGDTNDVIDCGVYYFGAFEWWVAMLLDDLVRRWTAAWGKPVLYDVGANTGHHSLYVAAGTKRIYAFEPYEPVLRKFRDHIARNELTHIEVLAVGLGDTEGEANYYAPATTNRGTGSFLAGTTPQNNRTPIRLPVTRGDRVVMEKGLLAPDIIKLDVEGSEKLVLRGLAETIRTHRPVILSELSSAARWLFSDEAGLRAALYPDCVLLEVARRKPRRGYRLRRFDFATSEQFLCVPRERAVVLGLEQFLNN